MYVETYYDEHLDRGVAVPGLSTDMGEAMETGVIHDIGLELEFNELESDTIQGRVCDVFEALEAARERAIENAKTPSSLNNQPGAPAGGVTPSEGGGDES